MKTINFKIVNILLLLGFFYLMGACTAEDQNQNQSEETISEKIAALKTTLAQNEELTTKEKRMLQDLTKSYEKASITVGEQNRSFSFDDLSKNHIEFNAINEVPVFESCSSETLEEQRTCMQNKIATFVTDHFDISVGEHLQVSGMREIKVSFVINVQGGIENVKTRYGEKILRQEAERVIAMLPRMQPGKHHSKTMAALYSLPIQYTVP